jgi:hypothetical protein
MGMTMSAEFRAVELGFEMASLMFLICCAPHAGPAQRIGSSHSIRK